MLCIADYLFSLFSELYPKLMHLMCMASYPTAATKRTRLPFCFHLEHCDKIELSEITEIKICSDC